MEEDNNAKQMKNYLAVNNPLLPEGSVLNPNDSQQGSFTSVELIQNFVTFGFLIAILLFVFWFLLGGIKWIVSGGDKNKVEEARSTVTNAIIGLTVLFGLYMIIGLLSSFFGIDLLQIDLNKIKIR